MKLIKFLPIIFFVLLLLSSLSSSANAGTGDIFSIISGEVFGKLVNASFVVGMNVLKTTPATIPYYLGYQYTTYNSKIQIYIDTSLPFNSTLNDYSLITSKLYNYYLPSDYLPGSISSNSFPKPLIISGACSFSCDTSKSSTQLIFPSTNKNYIDETVSCTYDASCSNTQKKISLTCPVTINKDYISNNKVIYAYNINYKPTCYYNGKTTYPVNGVCMDFRNEYCSNLADGEGCWLDAVNLLIPYDTTNPATWHFPYQLLADISTNPPTCSVSSPPSVNDQTCMTQFTKTFTLNIPSDSSCVSNKLITNNTPSDNVVASDGGSDISDGTSGDGSTGTTISPSSMPSFGDISLPDSGTGDIFLAKQVLIEQNRQNWKETLGIIDAILSIQEIIYNLIVLLYYIFELIALIYFFTALIPGIFVTIINLFKKATTLPNEVNQNE